MIKCHKAIGGRFGCSRRYPMARAIRQAARRLELRSYGLVSEHFSRVEGYRAGLAIAVPLAAAVTIGQAQLSWAVFTAFWTCLCNPSGPDRLRRRILEMFVLCGTLIAFVASWTASLAPAANIVLGPFFVFLIVLVVGRVISSGLLGTLLAVVAVVAIGFPHRLDMALFQAAAYFFGAAWAYILINHLWRTDPLTPLHRATDAAIFRLLDMAGDLSALGEGQHRDTQWHSEHAEHRRAVRLAVERLRSLLDRYGSEGKSVAPFLRARDSIETMFGALIALDQAFIDRIGPTEERLATIRACRTALLAWQRALRTGGSGARMLEWGAERLQRKRQLLSEPLFTGCLLAFENALALLLSEAPPKATAPIPVGGSGEPRNPSYKVLRQALRQSTGLVAVYCTTLVFQFGYPYWTAMAVIVVLQGDARVTWTRCLERILGSVLGCVVALAVLQIVGSAPALFGVAIFLAAAAIALRAVNYTVFVVFLTALFVIVTEMLKPGVGIASARMLDNIVGSIAALLAVFVLWPDFGAPLKRRIREGTEANLAYLNAVRERRPESETEVARRNAGLASIEAEVALHDPGSLLRRLRMLEPSGAALQELRTVAGEAAIAWHRQLAILAVKDE